MPTKDEIIADALLLLKSFKNDCRWKEFWREIHPKKIEERTKKILCLNVNKNKINNKNSNKVELDLDLDLDLEEKKKSEGLKTNLKPVNKFKAAPKGSENLEAALRSIERLILNHLMEMDERSQALLNAQIQKTLKELRKTNLVAMPTDKTNSVQLLDLNTYKKQVKKHLESSATEIKRETLTNL